MSDGNASSIVLACGAWLKNAACLRAGTHSHWSAVHGDLGDPAARIALDASVEALLDLVPTLAPGAAIAAVAHDLHPDFYSTGVALRVAAQLGVPAIGVQHHHAHIGAVMAEYGIEEPVIGVALDGVGLGTDGLAWGGELLHVAADGDWRRLGHLAPLALPGGDAAAREPWRMAAAWLHRAGRADAIVARYEGVVGPAARTVRAMLDANLNAPMTTSAGRWFDAAAGVLGISVRQGAEAEAAQALERRAARYLATHDAPQGAGLWRIDGGVLDPDALLARLFALADGGEAGEDAIDAGAALFHVALADALAQWAGDAAAEQGCASVALGGGCFMNAILSARVRAALGRRGLRVLLPATVSRGDAGLALGQAWVAQRQSGRAAARQDINPQPDRIPTCV